MNEEKYAVEIVENWTYKVLVLASSEEEAIAKWSRNEGLSAYDQKPLASKAIGARKVSKE